MYNKIRMFLKQVYNTSTCQIDHFRTGACMNVTQSKLNVISKADQTPFFPGITGVLKSSSGAAPVLVEHVFG